MTENDYACTFTCMLYMYYINHFILGTWKYLKFLDLKVCFKTDYKLHFTQWLLVINDIVTVIQVYFYNQTLLVALHVQTHPS